MIMNDAIKYEQRGTVAWITLNRPDQINAVNDGIRNGLVQALDQAEARPASVMATSHKSTSPG